MGRARTVAKAGPTLMTAALPRLVKHASKTLLRMKSKRSSPSLQQALTMMMALVTSGTTARQTKVPLRKLTMTMMAGPTISMSLLQHPAKLQLKTKLIQQKKANKILQQRWLIRMMLLEAGAALEPTMVMMRQNQRSRLKTLRTTATLETTSETLDSSMVRLRTMQLILRQEKMTGLGLVTMLLSLKSRKRRSSHITTTIVLARMIRQSSSKSLPKICRQQAMQLQRTWSLKRSKKSRKTTSMPLEISVIQSKQILQQ